MEVIPTRYIDRKNLTFGGKPVHKTEFKNKILKLGNIALTAKYAYEVLQLFYAVPVLRP
jgi:hypothetical protein